MPRHQTTSARTGANHPSHGWSRAGSLFPRRHLEYVSRAMSRIPRTCLKAASNPKLLVATGCGTLDLARSVRRPEQHAGRTRYSAFPMESIFRKHQQLELNALSYPGVEMSCRSSRKGRSSSEIVATSVASKEVLDHEFEQELLVSRPLGINGPVGDPSSPSDTETKGRTKWPCPRGALECLEAVVPVAGRRSWVSGRPAQQLKDQRIP